MNRRGNLWGAASLLITTPVFAWASGRHGLALLAVIALVASAMVPKPFTLARGAERLVIAIAVAIGVALPFLVPGAPGDLDALKTPWAATALALLLASTVRLTMTAPEGGGLATFVAGLAVLTASGQVRIGRFYLGAVVLYLVLGLGALRAGDAARPTLRELPRRAWIVSLAIFGIAGVLAQGFMRVLPPLSDWTANRMMAAFTGEPKTGFSDRLWLGSMAGLLASDEVVMRLDGPQTDYLRGAVYDRYQAGRWNAFGVGQPDPVATGNDLRGGPSAVRVTMVGGARDRYFLPLGARELATGEPAPRADRFGTLRAPASAAASAVSFTLGEPELPVADPTRQDWAVPQDLRAPLQAIVAEWTYGLDTPEAKVEAIEARLRRDYTYSLTFKRRRRDPLLDFLLDDHRGHCEYFASALALLARTAGVPARVVAGYRVAEKSPFGGYYIVREKNAHAWVEVFFEGRGWRTRDATPDADLPQNVPHHAGLAAALGDYVSAWWAGSATGESRLTLPFVIRALVLIIVVGFVVRQLRRRTRRARAAARLGTIDPAPPSLERLFDALARRGMVRAAAEPIERFARRLDGDLGGAGEALQRYAALRYGGIGDAPAIHRALDVCAERLRRDA